jgi:hypothetical protein
MTNTICPICYSEITGYYHEHQIGKYYLWIYRPDIVDIYDSPGNHVPPDPVINGLKFKDVIGLTEKRIEIMMLLK